MTQVDVSLEKPYWLWMYMVYKDAIAKEKAYNGKNQSRARGFSKTWSIAKKSGTMNQMREIQALKETRGISDVKMVTPIQPN